MNPARLALVFAAFLVAAAPAFAGTAGFELPRLSFPEVPDDATGQGCAAPATMSGTRCEAGDG